MKTSLKPVSFILILSALFIVLIFLYSTKNKEVASNSYELPKTNLATSSDGKIVAFYKNIMVDGVNKGELWIADIESGQNELLTKEGLSSSDDMAESSGNFPSIYIAVFSNNNQTLYFIDSFAHPVSGDLYSVDLFNKKKKFISSSNYIDVIRAGKYKDYLITNQHRYYDGGGSYDYYYITDPDTGKDIQTIGNSLDIFNSINK